MVDTIRTTAQLLSNMPLGINAISGQNLRDNLVSLTAKTGFFDYNDLATASSPITITGGAGATPLTNDELGPFTNKTYPPALITDVWDASGGVFDWSELSLGDMVDIRLDLEVTIASTNTEINIELHLGAGGGVYTIPFIPLVNVKSTGSYRGLRYNGIYMGDANTLNNGGQFKMSADKTCTVRVNGWYCKVTKYA